jgi:DNA uptake protein ComE-like DNA-binding protein
VNKRIALLIAGVVFLTGFASLVVRWEISSSGVAAGESDNPHRSAAQRVDINTASVRELERLPGMGPELVERIVQSRPYRKLDELITRKVLGRKQFARIKDRIRVGPASIGSVSQQ